jgi:hypothetical protein
VEFKTKPTFMKGCVAVLMVVLVDCITGNHLKMEESSRMNLYTEKLIMLIIQEHEKPVEDIAGINKRKRKVRKGTCYCSIIMTVVIVL